MRFVVEFANKKVSSMSSIPICSLKTDYFLTLVSFYLRFLISYSPTSSYLYSCDYLLRERASFIFLTSLIDVLKYFAFFMYLWIFCSAICTVSFYARANINSSSC